MSSKVDVRFRRPEILLKPLERVRAFTSEEDGTVSRWEQLAEYRIYAPTDFYIYKSISNFSDLTVNRTVFIVRILGFGIKITFSKEDRVNK